MLVKNVLLGFYVTSILVGCSADGGPTAELESVATKAETLSFSEQCGTLPADATITGSGNVTSPHSYNHTNCHNGYLIDVSNFTHGTGGASGSGVAIVRWADTEPSPSNQADCERADASIYVWDTTNSGGATALGAVAGHGIWSPIGGGPNVICQGPGVFVNQSPLAPVNGHSYRYAVSARQNFVNGGYATRQVFVDAH
jgi:hypothetical protein